MVYCIYLQYVCLKTVKIVGYFLNFFMISVYPCKQINTLTKKAMAGDTVTMDLVRDLQKRLEELETQIKSPLDNSVAGNRRSKSRNVGQGDANFPFSDLEGGQRSRKMTGSGSQNKGGDFEELKQERKQHRSELRQLQSELSRIRHNDPIRSVEISIKGLDYDESGLCLTQTALVPKIKAYFTHTSSLFHDFV